MQHELLSLDQDRVSRVVPPLIARHNVKLLAQHIDNFPLAFVAPLGPDNHHIGHFPISI